MRKPRRACCKLLEDTAASWAECSRLRQNPLHFACAQAWSLGLRFPVGAAAVAAVGFVLAAMWIDTLASELVAVLEYLGLLSGINHTVRPDLLSLHHACDI
jgi:hypothetical protein